MLTTPTPAWSHVVGGTGHRRLANRSQTSLYHGVFRLCGHTSPTHSVEMHSKFARSRFCKGIACPRRLGAEFACVLPLSLRASPTPQMTTVSKEVMVQGYYVDRLLEREHSRKRAQLAAQDPALIAPALAVHLGEPPPGGPTLSQSIRRMVNAMHTPYRDKACRNAFHRCLATLRDSRERSAEQGCVGLNIGSLNSFRLLPRFMWMWGAASASRQRRRLRSVCITHPLTHRPSHAASCHTRFLHPLLCFRSGHAKCLHRLGARRWSDLRALEGKDIARKA